MAASLFLQHLSTKREIDRVLLETRDRLVVLRFGKEDHTACMLLDEVVCSSLSTGDMFVPKLMKTERQLANMAAIFVVDTDAVPLYMRYFDITLTPAVVFFFNAQHMKVDYGSILVDFLTALSFKTALLITQSGLVPLPTRTTLLPWSKQSTVGRCEASLLCKAQSINHIHHISIFCTVHFEFTRRHRPPALLFSPGLMLGRVARPFQPAGLAAQLDSHASFLHSFQLPAVWTLLRAAWSWAEVRPAFLQLTLAQPA